MLSAGCFSCYGRPSNTLPHFTTSLQTWKLNFIPSHTGVTHSINTFTESTNSAEGENYEPHSSIHHNIFLCHNCATSFHWGGKRLLQSFYINNYRCIMRQDCFLLSPVFAMFSCVYIITENKMRGICFVLFVFVPHLLISPTFETKHGFILYPFFHSDTIMKSKEMRDSVINLWTFKWWMQESSICFFTQ